MPPGSIQTSTTDAPPLLYEVGAVSSRIKSAVEKSFPDLLRIRGEIFQLSESGRGHKYLTLKDMKSDDNLNAVIWSDTLHDPIKQGDKIICTGRIRIYKPQSRYQLVIESIELEGEGKLWALLDKLRKKLAAEGIFSNRRPIPFLPESIGIVTSPQGAVLQDIMHRLRERFPREIVLCPVPVQGEGAADQIADAIKRLNTMDSPPDIIIVARGGGSISDLWAFNEEKVARAVYSSSVPVISAIGHETDHTLTDEAADFRCPTPTAAAEKAVPVRNELLKRLEKLAQSLDYSTSILIHTEKGNVEGLKNRINHILPALVGQERNSLQKMERLISLGQIRSNLRKSKNGLRVLHNSFKKSFFNEISTRSEHFQRVSEEQNRAFTNMLRKRRDSLIKSEDVLEALSYERVLERGYSCVRSSESDKIITRAAHAHDTSILSLQFSDGKLKVKNITP